MSQQRSRPDWRAPQDYADLLRADRSLIAWEWLRRDPAYIAAAAAGQELRTEERAARFGLHAFEDPGVPVPHARPLWSAAACPSVATGHACSGAEDALDLRRLGEAVSLIRGTDDMLHLLVSDGLRAIRIDLTGACDPARPIVPVWRLPGVRAAEAPLLALRRFLAFTRLGRFATALHPPEPRARRWIQLLRAADALAEGACQRELAVIAGGASDLSGPGWRVRCPSARLQVQRLAAGARRMAAGGYRALLGPIDPNGRGPVA